jgi:hypothetical protein
VFSGLAKQLAALSVKVSETVPVDVPARGTLPAEPTVTAASAVDAATKVKRDASSAALMPVLIAFFHLVKSCTSLRGLD